MQVMADGPSEQSTAPHAHDESTHKTGRSIREIRLDLQTFRKQLRSAGNSLTYRSKILDMIWLHQEMTMHGQYSTNRQLQGFRVQAADCLKEVVKNLERDQNRNSKNSSGSAAAPLAEKPSRYQDSEPEEGDAWIGYQQRYFHRLTGGPLSLLGDLHGNFAPPFTDQELIQLIQTVIHPSFWRINGGEGVIEYYEPGLALIVLGSSEVQDEIADLLWMLRR